MSNKWENGLCGHVCGGDCGTCMGSWFCTPCLFGRVSSRYHAFPNVQEDSYCNGSCCLWFTAGLFGFHWVPQMMRRSAIRNKFGIEGNGCSDCCVACCCAPCGNAQMNMELKSRAEKQGLMSAQYAPPQQGMVYQAPRY